jgi:mRNA-degrading endonuclease RelE of RelBE toxin-antitoxin system
MIFIETPIFTADLNGLLTDDEYAEFQRYLADNPRLGDVIQDTGGLRKIRWSANGKGKRGGVRVIYYYLTADVQIRLLLIYKKGIQDNLTEKQKKILRKLNEGW